MFSRQATTFDAAKADTAVASPRRRLDETRPETGAIDDGLLVELHRAFGNRRVQRMVEQARQAGGSAPPLGPKLVIGPADDRYEREADRIAKQVVGPIAHAPAAAHAGPVEADAWVRRAIDNAQGGQPVPDPVRSSMEHALGADLRGIRVHTDAQSNRLNSALQADAFTSGRHLFFRRDTYAPQSRQGQALLAHELTHVVQQGATEAGRAAPTHGTIQCKMSFRYERLKKDGKLLEAPEGHGVNTLFKKIARNLEHYEKTKKTRVELERLQKLEVLAVEWLQMHSASTEPQVQQMTVQIKAMLPDVQAEIDGLWQERAEQYQKKIAATSWKTPPTKHPEAAKYAQEIAEFKDYQRSHSEPWVSERHFRYITQSGSQATWLYSSKHQAAMKAVEKYGLTEDEVAAIRVQTGGDYTYINALQSGGEERLRSGLEKLSKLGNETMFALEEARAEAIVGGKLHTLAGRRQLTLEALQHSRQVRSGLNKLPYAPPTTAVRGTKVPLAEFQSDYQKGGIPTPSNYPTSASFDRVQALGYATKTPRKGMVHVLLTMHITRGKDLGDISLYKEKEIIILPGSRFQVTKDPELLHVSGVDVWQVEMRQIDDAGSSSASSAASSNSSMNPASSTSTTSTSTITSPSVVSLLPTDPTTALSTDPAEVASPGSSSSMATSRSSNSSMNTTATTTMSADSTSVASTSTSSSTSTVAPARARASPASSLPVFKLKLDLGNIERKTWIQLVGIDTDGMASIQRMGSHDQPTRVGVKALQQAIYPQLLPG